MILIKKLRWGFAFILWFCLISPLGTAQTIPGFFISNLEGKRFYSKKQKEPMVISLFFIDCVPCIKEIPELYQLITTQFPHVALLFIDPIDTSKNDIKDFADRLKVPHRFFYASKTVGKRFFRKRMSFPTIIGIKNRRGRLPQEIFRFPGLNETYKTEIISALQ